MPNHVALSPVDHKNLRVSQERSDAMGDGMMCCITFPEEFRSLQAHYPILFQLNDHRSDYTCLALFGFENGENLFLKAGKWDARYVPLAMSVQPFLVGVSEQERKVVVDLNSPRLVTGEGIRVFDDTGDATEYLQTVSRRLRDLDAGYRNSSGFTNALKKYNLLEPLSIELTFADGTQNRLVGFHTIHEERLSALDGIALADLQAQGFLMPIYMALASLSKLGDLIDRRNVAGHAEL